MLNEGYIIAILHKGAVLTGKGYKTKHHRRPPGALEALVQVENPKYDINPMFN